MEAYQCPNTVVPLLSDLPNALMVPQNGIKLRVISQKKYIEHNYTVPQAGASREVPLYSLQNWYRQVILQLNSKRLMEIEIDQALHNF